MQLDRLLYFLFLASFAATALAHEQTSSPFRDTNETGCEHHLDSSKIGAFSAELKKINDQLATGFIDESTYNQKLRALANNFNPDKSPQIEKELDALATLHNQIYGSHFLLSQLGAQSQGKPLSGVHRNILRRLMAHPDFREAKEPAYAELMSAFKILQGRGAAYEGGWDFSKVTLSLSDLQPLSSFRSALEKFFAPEVINALAEPNRVEAVQLGDTMFLPLPSQETQFPVMTRADWEQAVTRHVDSFVRDVKDYEDFGAQRATYGDALKGRLNINLTWKRFGDAGLGVLQGIAGGFVPGTDRLLDRDVINQAFGMQPPPEVPMEGITARGIGSQSAAELAFAQADQGLVNSLKSLARLGGNVSLRTRLRNIQRAVVARNSEKTQELLTTLGSNPLSAEGAPLIMQAVGELAQRTIPALAQDLYKASGWGAALSLVAFIGLTAADAMVDASFDKGDFACLFQEKIAQNSSSAFKWTNTFAALPAVPILPAVGASALTGVSATTAYGVLNIPVALALLESQAQSLKQEIQDCISLLKQASDTPEGAARDRLASSGIKRCIDGGFNGIFTAVGVGALARPSIAALRQGRGTMGTTTPANTTPSGAVQLAQKLGVGTEHIPLAGEPLKITTRNGESVFGNMGDYRPAEGILTIEPRQVTDAPIQLKINDLATLGGSNHMEIAVPREPLRPALLGEKVEVPSAPWVEQQIASVAHEPIPEGALLQITNLKKDSGVGRLKNQWDNGILELDNYVDIPNPEEGGRVWKEQLSRSIVDDPAGVEPFFKLSKPTVKEANGAIFTKQSLSEVEMLLPPERPGIEIAEPMSPRAQQLEARFPENGLVEIELKDGTKSTRHFWGFHGDSILLSHDSFVPMYLLKGAMPLEKVYRIRWMGSE